MSTNDLRQKLRKSSSFSAISLPMSWVAIADSIHRRDRTPMHVYSSGGAPVLFARRRQRAHSGSRSDANRGMSVQVERQAGFQPMPHEFPINVARHRCWLDARALGDALAIAPFDLLGIAVRPVSFARLFTSAILAFFRRVEPRTRPSPNGLIPLPKVATHTRDIRRFSGSTTALRLAVLALLLPHLVISIASAQGYPDNPPPLIERVTGEILTEVFPEAVRVEMLADGGPSAVAAYDEATLVGYVFSTLDVVRAPGYSSIPFDVIAGVTLDGRITGARVLFHREPYLISDERRTQKLVQFLDAMSGLKARIGARGGHQPQFVAGATISARSMRNAVLQSAQIVLRYHTGEPAPAGPVVDMESYRPDTVEALIADGSLARIVVTNADLAQAMQRAGVAGSTLEIEPVGGADAVYLDLRVGLADPPSIGRNAGGDLAYDQLRTPFAMGSHALIFGSNGTYDFRGTKYRKQSYLLRLERIAVVQGRHTYEFRKPSLISAGSEIGEVGGIVLLPHDSAFDPLRPWRAEVYAFARRGNGSLQRFLLTSVDYRLPERHILTAEAEPEPLPAWMEPWIEGKTDLAILVTALTLLTLILAFQARLSRSRRAHRVVRNGFLVFTLCWLGWTVSAQLSIVHLINYLRAPFAELDWTFYLAEPPIVILALYTALSLLVLGRGVFCGWLCPFGALQELLARVARAIGLPQYHPPSSAQRYLWNGKYVALASVLGLTFVAPDVGVLAAEVEPFKTAITAMFVRGWPYVLYALVLLAIGLFTERAFCRFLCPLGGALALLDRLHLVDMLRRRPECGNPCALCERACPVGAIERSGKIRMNECFQCLDCQVEYFDEHRCPPLAILRKQRMRAALGPAVPKEPDLVPVTPNEGLAL